MKRRLAVVIVASVILAGAIGGWRACVRRPGPAARHREAHAGDGLWAGAHRDPRRLDRASIAGAIHDDTGAPIARARVCAELAPSDALPSALTRDPRCTASDDRGRYAIGELLAGDYRVAAMARSHTPAVFHPEGDRARARFALGSGEHRVDVDLVLGPGGVEVTGTVSDVSGGPIAHALVRAAGDDAEADGAGAAAETDGAGVYALWVAPGKRTVTAVADGYTPGEDTCRAPCKLDLRLLPESSLAGTVVDAATGGPVAGVRVVAFSEGDAGEADITDDGGRFQLTRLSPGRYTAVARAPTGYGRSAGSTFVGLAQHAGPISVTLYPAFRISGRVVVPGESRPACRDARVILREGLMQGSVEAERDPDGTLHIDGVLPGHYDVGVRCEGFLAHAHYPPIVVTDQDVTGLAWEVDAGATIRGHVRTQAGAPVDARMVVVARGEGEAADADGRARWLRTARDGGYELRGLSTGEFVITVTTPGGAPRVHVTVPSPGAVIEQDVIVEEGGTIRGRVVDAAGAAVAGVYVLAVPDAGIVEQGGRTGDDGGFTIDHVPVGDCEVTAAHAPWGQGVLHQPSGGRVEAKHVMVAAGETATVQLVVEPITGMITGVVEDARGAPVADAFVTATLETDSVDRLATLGLTAYRRQYTSDGPVVTRPDGTFTLTRLSEGRYTLTAERKAGGDAHVEHVAVGATATLRFQPTGRIEGMVRGEGGAPGVRASPTAGQGGADPASTTDEHGRFTIHHAARGVVSLTGTPKGIELDQEPDYDFLEVTRTITGTHTIELGDLPVVHLRVKDNDPVGSLGFTWVDGPGWHVDEVVPGGPAAIAGLRAGDIVMTIDGVELLGDRENFAPALLRAPPGTALRLGLARGATITLVLGPPS